MKVFVVTLLDKMYITQNMFQLIYNTNTNLFYSAATVKFNSRKCELIKTRNGV